MHLKAGRSLAEAQRTVADYEDKLKGKGTTHNLLTLRGIKLYMDGAPPGRTALMFEDYACCPGERGLLVFRGETEEEQIQEINNTIEWFHGQGFQLGLHVDGDRAAHIAINGLIRAMEAGPPGPRADTPRWPGTLLHRSGRTWRRSATMPRDSRPAHRPPARQAC